jgi:hypothetical protein
MFIILEQFPLSSNGKIDRKALPPPKCVAFTELVNDDNQPITPMEVDVHDLWCEVLHMDRISIQTSFFALHGTSLLFMKLYNFYQFKFGIAPDIVTCLRQATIKEHAELLIKVVTSTSGTRYQSWSCLHLDYGNVND